MVHVCGVDLQEKLGPCDAMDKNRWLEYRLFISQRSFDIMLNKGYVVNNGALTSIFNWLTRFHVKNVLSEQRYFIHNRSITPVR